MSTIVEGYNNKRDILLKGAPDRILAKCTQYMRLTEDGAKGVHAFIGNEKN